MNLSPAFLRALLDAEHYHHEQIRKGTTIPYFSHLLGVCSIALEAGATRPRPSQHFFTTRPKTRAVSQSLRLSKQTSARRSRKLCASAPTR